MRSILSDELELEKSYIMELVGVSGSTVCDWVLMMDKEDIVSCSTMGINPYFHNEVSIQRVLDSSKELIQYADKVNEVFFYGAGCSSDLRKETVIRALSFVFKNADIYVGHDMKGAVYAVSDQQPCIVSVIGTGSNSCYYDGKKMIENFPALGHLLGDEASGAYFGKKLLRQFLYRQLPADIQELLEKEHALSAEIIFRNVYENPQYSNIYFASFMRTISSMKDHEYVKKFIYEGLSRFIKYHIWTYKEYKTVETHFVGSIGFFFEDILRECCYNHRVKVGKIIRRPIFEVAKFHKYS